MSIRTVLTVAIAGAALAACGHDGLRASLPASGLGLFFNDQGADVALAYGRAGSDDVGLMLQCRKGAGTVTVSDVLRQAPAPQLVLSSGGGRSVLSATVQPGQSAEPRIVEADAAVDAPALQGLRRSGRIEVAYGEVRYSVRASAEEKAGVDRFFSACQTA